MCGTDTISDYFFLVLFTRNILKGRTLVVAAADGWTIKYK
jgi:hypothetical protein